MDYNEQRLEYLAQIASLYYDQNKNQQQIADQIGVTRSAVSRLLTEARSKGVVEIIVHYPYRTSPELEKALLAEFNLKAVRVLVRENKSYPDMLKGLGVIAAEYFCSILAEGSTIGITWGTGLHYMVHAIHPMSRPDLEVVQLIGGTGTEKGSADGPLLAPFLANHLNCRCWYLYAPFITESETTRTAILNDRSIRETLEQAEKVDIALIGIGATTSDLNKPLRLGYMTEEELSQVRRAGGIGIISATHYSIDGKVLDDPTNRRTIGISLEALTRVKYSIGVAGDIRKAQAIYGGLTGGYVNVLITDDQAARKVLELKQNFSKFKR